MPIILPYTIVFLFTWLISFRIPKNDYDLQESNKGAVKPLKEGAFVFILFIIMFFSAFRHIQSPAIDEWIYRPRINYFRGISLFEALDMQYSKGISFMYWLGAKFFSTSQGSMIISTLFTVPALMIGMRKHCYDFTIGLAMLFLTGYIATEFNGIAQCIATAFFVYSFDRVYNGKFMSYCFVIFLCYLFHRASVFLIPVYFYARTQHGSLKNIGVSIAAVFLIIFLYRSIPSYGSILGLDDYVDVVSNGHHGVRLLSIFVSICPALLSLTLPREVILKDRITNAAANMVMLHAVLALASSIDVYIARFELFTAPFISIFFSRYAAYIKGKNLFYYLVAIAYYIVFAFTYSQEYYFFQFS